MNKLTLKKQTLRKLTIKTGVKAGVLTGSRFCNHNQKVVRRLRVKTGVKAGGLRVQHNQRVVRRLRVRTGVKAGRYNNIITLRCAIDTVPMPE